jgi:hypothetical protein
MEDHLYMTLMMNLNGERDKIIETLEQLSEVLQKEVDDRASRQALIAGNGITATPVDAVEFTSRLTEFSNRLGLIFQQAETTFEEASSVTGTPEMFRLCYATLLERTLAIEKALWSVSAPKAFGTTESAYRAFVCSVYEQVAAWPARLAADARNVIADSHESALGIAYDLRPFHRALEAETATATR